MTAKPISIKGTGCKSGGCAWKVVGLTSGGLSSVLESGLSNERSEQIGRQKSAEGIVGEGNEPDKVGRPHSTEGPNGRKGK